MMWGLGYTMSDSGRYVHMCESGDANILDSVDLFT